MAITNEEYERLLARLHIHPDDALTFIRDGAVVDLGISKKWHYYCYHSVLAACPKIAITRVNKEHGVVLESIRGIHDHIREGIRPVDNEVASRAKEAMQHWITAKLRSVERTEQKIPWQERIGVLTFCALKGGKEYFRHEYANVKRADAISKSSVLAFMAGDLMSIYDELWSLPKSTREGVTFSFCYVVEDKERISFTITTGALRAFVETQRKNAKE